MLNSQEVLIGLSKQAQNYGYQFERIYRNFSPICISRRIATSKIKTQYQKGKAGWGIPYSTKTETNKVRYFYNQGYAMKKTPNTDAGIDKVPNTAIYAGRTELEQRISARKCEMCGAENVSFEIHHIHALKDLEGKEEWEKWMISRCRKTLVLCTDCHNNIHHS